MSNILNEVLAVSPIDGRYFENTSEISEYFSEYALFKTRVEIEIKYLIFLSTLGITKKLTPGQINSLTRIYKEFSPKDAVKIKITEKRTRHDVKAVEYFIRSKFNSSPEIIPWIHFGITSADINENAYRLMITKSLSMILVKEIKSICNNLGSIAKKYKELPMVARTHGQAAVPTTFGKEIAVFNQRLNKELNKLKIPNFYGKFGGAVGNWNALRLAYPDINWPFESKIFLKKLGLNQAKITTQVAPAEDIVQVLQNIFRINSILIDLNQDMWRYISDDWINQKGKLKFVGSSTMPQKINPIEFENSEGNLFMANGIIETLVRKLSISRLQRDLSDSTMVRNIGTIFAHSLIAYKSCKKGLNTIEPNKEQMRKDLLCDWSILSEAVQTILRKNGKDNAYEKISEFVRGKKMSENDYLKLVKSLDINADDKKKLLKLSPINYLGYSNEL